MQRKTWNNNNFYFLKHSLVKIAPVKIMSTNKNMHSYRLGLKKQVVKFIILLVL